MSYPRNENTRGFTLLELVVVTAFIAVLTGMIVPIYNRAMYSLRVRNTIQEITSTIRYAQEKAVAESREFRILIDEKNNEIRTVRLVEIKGDKKEFEPISDNEGGVSIKLPDTVKISRVNAGRDRTLGMYYISCYPSGASDPAQIEIQTADRAHRRIVIKSLGALGRFEVK
ncbi:MAG: hypothetical protein N3G21_12970 [Candidatus Hydrogenedentes bacterium]|nr:hypothetical protein [Candidatus Hydrogenedentota bacterium]